MPELPEVETVVRDLRPLLVGHTIRGISRGPKSLRKTWSPVWEAVIIGQTITAVNRRGKWILVELRQGLLMVHLGMTGQFTVQPRTNATESHTHLVFQLSEQTDLRFRDIRRFGSVTYFPDSASWEAFLADKLGPEPWDMPLDQWREALERTNRNLKAILLDQTIMAGVGNIYADESCHAAKLNPQRTGKSLTATEAKRLLDKVRAVLTKAIESRGSTIRNYVGGSGLEGGYQDEFQVYGRTGLACLRCQVPIECIRLAGRSTHFCPVCQG